MVKALASKSNGIFPRIFNSCSQRDLFVSKKQLWKESNASSGWHWNDEVEHSALNLFAQAAMAERLRRWTRNPMGSSRAGSNSARSEIFLCLREPALERKPCVKWFHWNDEVEHSALNLIASDVMAEWLRRWTRNPMGSSRAGSVPARSETFLCQKNQVWKESNASSDWHWNDEIEHSALNFIAPAAMAEWLKRWTRNSMGPSREGSNPARSEIFLC